MSTHPSKASQSLVNNLLSTTYYQQLIINNLAKHNSLQTFTGGQGTCISDDELAGRGTKEGKLDFVGKFFHPTASLLFWSS